MTSPIFRTPGPLAFLLVLLPVAVAAWTGPCPLTAQERERPLPNAADFEIYGLAVDSTAFPEESTVLLIQERTFWVDAGDGTYPRGPRQVRQVLDESGVEGLRELVFGYRPHVSLPESDGVHVEKRPSRSDAAPRVLEQRFDVPQRSLTADADTSKIPLWVGAAVGAGAGLVYGISVCQSIEAHICIPVIPALAGALVGTLVVAIVR